MERLRSFEVGLSGRRNLPSVTALLGWEALLCEVGEKSELAGDRGKLLSFCRRPGDVARRGSFGRGTGLGLRYLSAGSMVRTSDVVELTLSFLSRFLLEVMLKGTCNTFTSCPGSKGHDVVEGSAEL